MTYVADEESGQKPGCSARCKRVFFGLFLCVTMLLFGFILMVVGGAKGNTAVVILGVVFFVGSFVFLFIICWTKRKRLEEKLCGLPCCAGTAEEKYTLDNDDQSVTNGQTQIKSSNVHNPATTSSGNGANNGAFFLDPGQSSTDDKTETFELK